MENMIPVQPFEFWQFFKEENVAKVGGLVSCLVLFPNKELMQD